MKRTFLTCLLTFLLVFLGPASLFAQGTGANNPDGGVKPLSVPTSEPGELTGFIIRQVNGEIVCLDATPAELLQIKPLDPDVPLRQLNHLSKDETSARGSVDSDGDPRTGESVTGLKIILRGTEQLNAHAEAAAAFARAAAVWESLITSDITVVIDVDFGTTRFGTAYGDGVLGSTSGGIFFIPSYTSARARLLDRASTVEETGLYGLLPASSLPTDLGDVTQVAVASPIARALGFSGVPPHAEPNPTPDPNGPGGKSIDAFGNAPSIGFNSNFTFDFNPADGIAPNTTDFTAVAVHEIGHALGFTSQVGQRELSPETPLRVSVWDLFRFRPGTGPASFTASPRVLSSGGEHVHFDGAPELALSTGKPNGEGGDGRQSSHWKDDAFTGVFIGIMDPTIPRGQSEELTSNDRRAVNFFGYQVGAGPPPPSNDNFVNAVEVVGPAGTVTGTSSNATKETGEPLHAGNRGGHSVWYRWTAPSTGSITFDTVGSSFDTTLAAYTGSSVGALTPLASNDDIQDGVVRTSRISFSTTAGTTYHIALDGWNGDFGSIVLNWSASTFTISGRISSTCCGPTFIEPSGITVTLSGAQTATTTTDASGFYRFQNLAGGGNYTVTPSKAGAVFTPASATFNNLSQNQTADFGVTTPMFTVSGVVNDPSGNPIVGAPVLLGRGLAPELVNPPTEARTNAEGRFSFSAQGGRDYWLSVAQYTAQPSIVTFPSLNADQSVTFVASRPKIFGRVTDADGLPVVGATVDLGISGTHLQSATTNAEGRYSFSNIIPSGNYTLTTSKAGQFMGETKTVNNVLQDTTVDLQLFAYIRITGNVADPSGKPIGGAVVSLSGLGIVASTGSNGQFFVNVTPRATAPVTLRLTKIGYTFNPAELSFSSASGGNQTFNFTGTVANQIDSSEFFVAQHYRDFLGREPDAGGLNFWTNGIESCGSDATCVALKRTDTSAAFFLSIEFQETGFLVQRLYKAAYGDATGQATQNGVPVQIPVPVVRMDEFFPDTQRIGQNVIVGTAGWPERLDANKTAFAQEFVSRARFAAAFPSTMTPAAFVNALNTNAGNVLSDAERTTLIAELTANNTTAGRASVLRKVAEDADLAAAERNRAFVLMQFFGYMRRNPNDLPDTNYGGYNFWLGKLNDNGGDYHKAQMVLAFLDSIEYRNRFR
ncbi:MAG TPA: NF038122 family metalloprotease [Pyrinomonadaceae bacterium]|nr:NF038122 family metalloprotease [Pyrinomonadaceae bacterium]